MRLLKRMGVSFNGWFWLNYAFCLAITLPIPLVEISVNGQFARRMSIWENYTKVFQGELTFWPFMDGRVVFYPLFTVAMHLLVCFLICFAVWCVLYPPQAPAAKETLVAAAPECDCGCTAAEDAEENDGKE